jgi:hypothetical protein
MRLLLGSRLARAALSAGLLAGPVAAAPETPAAPPAAAWSDRGVEVLRRAATRACTASAALLEAESASSVHDAGAPAVRVRDLLGTGCAFRPETVERFALASSASGGPGSRETGAVGAADGALLARQRLGTVGGVSLDLVAYASDGLAVGGVACYVDDGRKRPGVVHVHGGLTGLFDPSDGGTIQACVDWAGLHGRTAFVPSLRGLDGSEGKTEICLGEADDVAAAAAYLRSMPATDATRIALVGGSVGGCVVLKAAPLVPNLRAVAAFVPPTDWKGFIQFHRTGWAPATETRCDGSTFSWNIGGPALADVFDGFICGHPGCTDEDYAVRSPIPGVLTQTAPTIIESAGSDNVVPLAQEVLWSLLRQSLGNPVDVFSVSACDPPGTPPNHMDVHIFVPGGFHLLAPGPISSGLLFVINQLDRP